MFRRLAVLLVTSAAMVGLAGTASALADTNPVQFQASIPAEVTLAINPPSFAAGTEPNTNITPLDAAGDPVSFGSTNGGTFANPAILNPLTTTGSADEAYQIDVSTNDAAGYTLSDAQPGFTVNGQPVPLDQIGNPSVQLSQAFMYSTSMTELPFNPSTALGEPTGGGQVNKTSSVAANDTYAVYPQLMFETINAGVYSDTATFTAAGN